MNLSEKDVSDAHRADVSRQRLGNAYNGPMVGAKLVFPGRKWPTVKH